VPDEGGRNPPERRSGHGLGGYLDPASDKLRQYKLREGLPVLLERLAMFIHLAHTLGLKVCIGCEDASRASDATLRTSPGPGRRSHPPALCRYGRYPRPVHHRGANLALREVWPGELEMHAHNDLGMATANTLAAVRAGATSVNTTVLGLGERAGNAALETVALGLERCLEVKTGVRFTALPALCEQVALATRRHGPQQPLVGELVFTHESGVHVAALLRDSESYQAIAPSLMGRGYRLVLGKHSGRQAVNGVFDQMGYHLNAAQINQLLPAIRRFAENWKRSPKDYELAAIYDELCSAETPCRPGGEYGVVLSDSRRGRTALRRCVFQFFAVPYQPERLAHCSLPVLATFHRKLKAEVPLQNQLEDNPRALAAGAPTAGGELSATVSGEHAMRPKFTFSEEVRVVRAIRNDGTYAGLPSGALLVRRGSIGYVRDWGVFLQDQIIYQIHFPDCDRMVGCREQELIAGDRPWLAGNLQYGDSVICQMALAMQGEMVVSVGQLGTHRSHRPGRAWRRLHRRLRRPLVQVPAQALALAEEENNGAMATIWPAAAGAEPLELRAGGHRRGRPAGLRTGLAAPVPDGAAHRRPGAPEAIPPRCWRASPLRWAPGWMREDLRQRSARRSSCTTPGWKPPSPILPARRRSRILPRCRPGICGIRRSLCARNSA
jgi:homocitrate synthase NifV